MSWQQFLLTSATGFCGGAVVATALAAFIISLGIIPRYAGITHTAKHILLYEDFLMLGSILGNLIFIYKIPLPIGQAGEGLMGLFFGMFLGSWIIALGEVVNVFAITAKKERDLLYFLLHWAKLWEACFSFSSGKRIAGGPTAHTKGKRKRRVSLWIRQKPRNSSRRPKPMKNM